MDVITPEVHIIRSVDQRYVLDGFGSVTDYALSGVIDSHADVAVDTSAQTTDVQGTATGAIEVTGALSGSVQVDLTIGGGRNYTEATATPIVVEGTFNFGGIDYAVSGGFQRQ